MLRAVVIETVPGVAQDPEAAIVQAINDTWDNDTIAAVVGAPMGALHGEDALPRRWRDGLLGRTSYDDDGHISRLLDRAEARLLS
jgi:ADP-ribosylglycohydrolase